LARVAARFAVSSESSVALLPGACRKRAVVTGNPVRAEVLSGQPDKAVEALGLHGFDRGLPTVYVTGGAQGALQINALVSEILPWLLARANVIHQCGPAHLDDLRRTCASLPAQLAGRYLPVGFIGAELPDVFALADVVVSRSGAGTIAELTALGKAAILIPLASSAGGEQMHNARYLDEAGAAVALLGEVTSESVREAVGALLTEPGRRDAMAKRARACGHPDAADRLVDLVLQAGHAGQ
jgi:UDP-N-acetylglucosamine--N-acetylmuramyl-(pentapeptide) pyrophosphoryl-undecaprenol N-acetylglucosamine transferase